jgi:putative FmdB family regulatory protein
MNINRYYICDACDHHFELLQDRDEPLKQKCPKCKKNKLYQDLTGQHSFVYQEPKTVGHLADRNTAKMGKYELETKRSKHKKVRKEGHKTWYNPEGKDLPKTLNDIDTVPKAQKYIMTGEK